MTQTLWSCQCGRVQAEVATKGNHIVCYCADCRAFVESLGTTDGIDGAGGNALFQTPPHGVTITRGTQHLRYTRRTEKGPLRWHTGCCRTPMANTLPTPKMPFASFQVAGFQAPDDLPPVRARVNLKGATAHVAKPHGSLLPLIAAILGNTVTAYLTGRISKHPFFDASGHPIGPRHDP